LTGRAGHAAGDGARAEQEWAGLTAAGQTLGIYRGVGHAKAVRDRLLAHGRAPTTRTAVIENGTRPDQQAVVGSLAALPDMVRDHAITGPALILVGEVVARADADRVIHHIDGVGAHALIPTPELAQAV